MFGYGSLQDRVQTCFEVFDDDGNCMIDQAEMLGFMQSCIETMRAMDVMRKVPSEKVLKVRGGGGKGGGSRCARLTVHTRTSPCSWSWRSCSRQQTTTVTGCCSQMSSISECTTSRVAGVECPTFTSTRAVRGASTCLRACLPATQVGERVAGDQGPDAQDEAGETLPRPSMHGLQHAHTPANASQLLTGDVFVVYTWVWWVRRLTARWRN